MPRLHTAALGAAIALFLIPSTASAATVANPGPVTASFTDGSMKLGGGLAEATITPASTLTWSGTVDENGNVSFPASGLSFPPVPGSASVTVPGFGVQTFTIASSITPHDASGTIDPATGAVSVTVPLHATVTVTPPPALAAFVLPTTCTLGSAATPFQVALTTGTSGALTGTPYNQSDGTLSLVNGTFSIPTPPGTCTGDPLSSTIAGLLTLGSGNEIRFTGALNPILTAPLPPASPTTTTTQQQSPQQQQPTTTPDTTGTGTGGGPLGTGATGRCVVPKLKGLKLRKAKAALTKAGCKVGKVKKRKSRKRKGTVIASTPKAGTILAPGTKVTLSVSKGLPRKKRKK